MKKLWTFLVSNFDTLIALLVSIFAAIYGVFSGDQLPLLAGIAATLGILAFGLIRDRSNRETLADHVLKLEHAVAELSSGKVNAERFFYSRNELPELSSRLRNARYSLDIMGTSLFSIGVTHQSALRELKNGGVKIRLLVSNPDNSSLQEFLSMRYLETESAAVHIDQVRASLNSMAQLLGSTPSGGSIEVRISNHVQTFSYIATDAEKPYGEIQVEFYLSKTGLDRDPMFLLRSSNDERWFKEFRNQFDFLWEHSINFKPKKYIKNR